MGLWYVVLLCSLLAARGEDVTAIPGSNCSDPHSITLELGAEVTSVVGIDTCNQQNTFDGTVDEVSLQSSDYVIRLEPSADRREVSVRTLQTSFDTVLVISESCSLAEKDSSVTAFNDEIFSLDLDSELRFIADVDTVYHVVLEGFDGACGPATMLLQAFFKEPEPPASPPAPTGAIHSCSDPLRVSVPIGGTEIVSSFTTCSQNNSNDGVASGVSLSSQDKVQVVSQRCFLEQTSDTVDHFDKSRYGDAQNTFVAQANTAYFIIYEIENDCGPGEVTIEASAPPVKCSCSSPCSVSVEIGGSETMSNIDTCLQDNSNDGEAYGTTLGSPDFVILLSASSDERQIVSTASSSSSYLDKVQVISQQCITNQTSDTVDHLSVEDYGNARNTFIVPANTEYYIIYEIEVGCGKGQVQIEAFPPPKKYSCSSPYSVSVEIGQSEVVDGFDTCEQDNSNDGTAYSTSLGASDFVIFLEASSDDRQIVSTSSSPTNLYADSAVTLACKLFLSCAPPTKPVTPWIT